MEKNPNVSVQLNKLRHDSTSLDPKMGASRSEYIRRRSSVRDQVHNIDDIATSPEVTLDSFKHLDEKKLLRKIDMHLLPTLTALCIKSLQYQ